jgi:hypothetical protein
MFYSWQRGVTTDTIIWIYKPALTDITDAPFQWISFLKRRPSLSHPFDVIIYEGLHICVLCLHSFSPKPFRSFMSLRKKCKGNTHPLPVTSNGPVEVFQTFTIQACSLTKESLRLTHNRWSRITEQWTINTLWQHGGPKYISLSYINFWTARNSKKM